MPDSGNVTNAYILMSPDLPVLRAKVWLARLAFTAERKVVVDTQSGMAAEVENVDVAVKMDYGTVRQQIISFVQQEGN